MTETRQHNDRNQTTSTAVAEKPLIVVNGSGNTITLATAQDHGRQTLTGGPVPAPEPHSSRFWANGRRVGAFLVGATTVGASLAAIAPSFR